MFKSYQDTSTAGQFRGFPNLNFQGSNSAYGFSGVSFWLDAAFGLNTQTNLGAVGRWQPRVGNGIFGQGTAGSQPRLILNDVNYNNLPSIQSVDSSRVMSAANGFRLNSSGFTLAIVSKVNTALDVNVLLSVSVGAPYIDDGGILSGFNGFGLGGLTFQTQSSFQGTTESLNPRIKIMTSSNIIVNGNNEFTGNFGNNLEFVNLFEGGAANRRFIGTLAEIILFDYTMTSTDAIALSDRINQKYALY
jgi:hypothetical protein